MQGSTSLVVAFFAAIAAAQSGLPQFPDCVNPYVFGVEREAGCPSNTSPQCVCSKARPSLEAAIRQDCPDMADQRSALGTLQNYCANVTPTPTPTPTPQPVCNTANPGVFSLPQCIQGYAIPIVRQACGSNFQNAQCVCAQRAAIYQAYRGQCSSTDQTCAGRIFDSLCANVTPTPTPTPSPFCPAPSPAQTVTVTVTHKPKLF